MDFETLLGNGYVVAADDWMNFVVVWNGSATFNVWSQRSTTDWAECEVFTHYEVRDAAHAKLIARKWIAARYTEMEEYFGQEAA